MKKPVSRSKAASKASSKKPRAATSLKKPRAATSLKKPRAATSPGKPQAASKAKSASRTTVEPVVKPAAAKKAKGLWPSLSIGLAAAGDAAAVGASLLACLAPRGDASGLYAHLARSLGAQFAGATAPARRRAAKALGAESIDAAREILERLKAYLEAANLISARGAEIDGIFALLDRAKQRQFQSAFGKMALAVTQERNIADLPALMSAAIDGVISQTEVPKQRKPRKA